MDLYLITGFLGAGKTTFLKEFIHQFEGKKLWLIINDFGKVGVDGQLLRKLNAVMAEISNGSIFCACRLDQFEEALDEATAHKPDVIVVEASGLADPTGVEKLLGQQKFQEISYRGSICLVNTPQLERVIHTARVLPKQIRVSSLILLNKTDLATQEQIHAAEQTIRNLNPLAEIRQTQFGHFDPAWTECIHMLISGDPDKLPDIQMQKQLVKVGETMTCQQLYSALGILAEESWRIKGFVHLDGKTYLVNCVGPSIQVTESEDIQNCENHLVLLAGPGMALRKAIREAIHWYPELLRE